MSCVGYRNIATTVRLPSGNANCSRLNECLLEHGGAALTEYHPDNDKDEYCAEAATAEFFCPVSGDQGPKEIVHRKVFQALNYKDMPAAESNTIPSICLLLEINPEMLLSSLVEKFFQQTHCASFNLVSLNQLFEYLLVRVIRSCMKRQLRPAKILVTHVP